MFLYAAHARSSVTNALNALKAPGLVVVLGSFLTAACGPAVVGDDLDTSLALEEGQSEDDCPETTLAGTEVPLVGRAHSVSGTLTIVDGCTLALEDFNFDGGGLDVRAMVAGDLAGLNDDDERTLLSEDLRRSGGYEGSRLVFPLPAGLSVDDVGAFSIWCLPVGQSFGDAEL